MNWGKGITVAMIAFMSFIAVMIIILMSNKVDLVSEDYYQQEIVYGDEIIARNNWQNTYEPAVLSESESHLVIALPKIEGVSEFNVDLRRPNDKNDDLHFTAAQTQTFLIDRNKLKRGTYDYRISALANGKKFMITGKYYIK